MRMLIKIIRNLTLEEIDAKIKGFEKEFGVSFEKFKEHFLKHKPDAKLTTVYFEWAELVNSYKGYIEEGQLDYIVEEIKDLKPEQAALLTPKRMELLYQLATLRVDSINDLATKIRRNVKNVYQDLQVLRRFGFVRMNSAKGESLFRKLW